MKQKFLNVRGTALGIRNIKSTDPSKEERRVLTVDLGLKHKSGDFEGLPMPSDVFLASSIPNIEQDTMVALSLSINKEGDKLFDKNGEPLMELDASGKPTKEQRVAKSDGMFAVSATF